MITYAVYDTSGAITKVLTVTAESLAGNLAPGEAAIEILLAVDPDTCFIDLSGDAPSLEVRPVMPLTVGSMAFTIEESVTISGIPAGTLFQHPDGEDEIDDGFIEWGALEPGKYTLQLVKFPYVTERFYAEVSEA
ncbi:MAG TPA: hypothetical protein VGE69_00965 [Pseudomonadales bacterium]